MRDNLEKLREANKRIDPHVDSLLRRVGQWIIASEYSAVICVMILALVVAITLFTCRG